jgi:2,4-dienoyl-CoA reductase-like NADH-dependent reductase (Old Yellow Enzyme family)
MTTPRLFQPFVHGRLSLRNRVVMAPMTRRMAADDGIVTRASLEYYRRRAAGEVGLIVSEGTAIDSRHAYDTPTVPRIETEEQIAAWGNVVAAVRAEGGAFAPQLWHTGRLAADPIGPIDAEMPPRADGTPRPRVRAMTADDFEQVLDAFERAARGCVAIGCDALEIHGAHGYLLDSFLSESTNGRTDEWGGSIENRMRFPLAVIRRVRAAVGPDFPILYRFSQWKMEDYREIKFRSPDDLRVWVEAAREAGVDVFHVSTRRATDPAFEPEVDPAGRTLASWTRELSGRPVVAVGAVTVTRSMDETRDGATGNAVADPAPALRLLEDGEADLLAVGRALIANPDWARVVREGRWRELIPYDSKMLATLD